MVFRNSEQIRIFSIILNTFWSVLGIRIRMFLDLQDPDPVVRYTDPAPDPSLFS
jgi:hypothetical protein